jgi:hypothetical protein
VFSFHIWITWSYTFDLGIITGQTLEDVMAAHFDAFEEMIDAKHSLYLKDEWHERMVSRDCSLCEHFEHTYCDCLDSDHYGHVLLPFHPACGSFRLEDR